MAPLDEVRTVSPHSSDLALNGLPPRAVRSDLAISLFMFSFCLTAQSRSLCEMSIRTDVHSDDWQEQLWISLIRLAVVGAYSW